MVSILSAGVRSLGRSQVAPLTSEEIVTRAFEDARGNVYHYLLTLGLPAAQAQEATQEVFFRLYLSLENGERIQSLRGWIFRVAHNYAVTLRRQEDLNVVFDPHIETNVTDPNDTPEQALLRKERRLQFHRAVSTLSEQQQTCLYLRADGFRYREIAEIMGVSDSTVSEFLRRALTRLRKALHV
jgi:RNA polymerase sigma-70 factor (ECF subfamily)